VEGMPLTSLPTYEPNWHGKGSVVQSCSTGNDKWLLIHVAAGSLLRFRGFYPWPEDAYSIQGCSRFYSVPPRTCWYSVFTTAWRVLRLRMEGRPPDTEGSCKYIE
jgi:hypothetical protein